MTDKHTSSITDKPTSSLAFLEIINFLFSFKIYRKKDKENGEFRLPNKPEDKTFHLYKVSFTPKKDYEEYVSNSLENFLLTKKYIAYLLDQKKAFKKLNNKFYFRTDKDFYGIKDIWFIPHYIKEVSKFGLLCGIERPNVNKIGKSYMLDLYNFLTENIHNNIINVLNPISDGINISKEFYQANRILSMDYLQDFMYKFTYPSQKFTFIVREEKNGPMCNIFFFNNLTKFTDIDIKKLVERDKYRYTIFRCINGSNYFCFNNDREDKFHLVGNYIPLNSREYIFYADGIDIRNNTLHGNVLLNNLYLERIVFLDNDDSKFIFDYYLMYLLYSLANEEYLLLDDLSQIME